MTTRIYDVAVVGGGINGAGIAAEAQDRGLKTLLIEKNDLASATSSASSKLIHGGLRYLEHYEFRLVREALNEREVLLKSAPHLVRPLRFILPHEKHLRPAWMIRAGLFLYDHLGRRDVLPASKGIRFDADSPLKAEFTKGFEYADCWVDDARLVALKALQCQESGGDVMTRHTCTSAVPEDALWQITLKSNDTGLEKTVRARALVNAAGTGVNQFLSAGVGVPATHPVRLIRGSHIVLPRLYDDDNAFILQNSDGRIVFVIPYLGEFSMIGTTDVEHQGSTDSVTISPDEIHYLCDTVNRYFKRQITEQEIVWSFSGLRALYGDDDDSPQAISRDYFLELSDDKSPPLLSVFGGKLTTFRKLSEKAVALLEEHFDGMQHNDRIAPLPGAEMGCDIASYINKLLQRYPFLSHWTLERLATSYGARAETILKNAGSQDDLGTNFGREFTQAEVDYLVEAEFARTADDVLWRRSKMGLFLSAAQRLRLEDYFREHHPLPTKTTLDD